MAPFHLGITQTLYFTFAVTLGSAWADPITDIRINELPAPDQSAWHAYLENSRASALKEQAALQAEVTANHMPTALRAPSGGDYKLKTEPGDAWFGSEEAKFLAESILSYQTPTGGWSKHIGFGKGTRKAGMQWTSQSEPGQPFHYPNTFDNGSTTSEMDLLAGVWLATKREDCKVAVIRGLNFILASQYPGGGWPQCYPLEGVYHDDITLNDDAMTHILQLLHSIASAEPAYAFLDNAQRQQAAVAFGMGLDCILKTQVVVNGSKTVWCAQFDPITLQPSAARKMEPATLSGMESAKLLKFLMEISAPKPELIACIESGLEWFETAKLTDSSSGVRWARFYDLKTGKPIFPGRDGIIYETFEAMAAKNKLGYDFYTTTPDSVITTRQAKWRKLLAKQITPSK